MPRIALIIACVLITAGCGKDDDTTPAPTPVVSAGGSVPVYGGGPQYGGGVVGASPSVLDDPPGTLTCAALGVAIQRANLMQAGVVAGIVAASRTADAPVADAAGRLNTAYAHAVAASGQDDEADAIAAVSAAAADMAGVCGQSGLETNG